MCNQELGKSWTKSEGASREPWRSGSILEKSEGSWVPISRRCKEEGKTYAASQRRSVLIPCFLSILSHRSIHVYLNGSSWGSVAVKLTVACRIYLNVKPILILFMQPLFHIKSIKMVGFKLATVAALSGFSLAVPNIGNKGDWKTKIKNVIVLVEENRSFDIFAGGLSYSLFIDGLLHHNYCNSM